MMAAQALSLSDEQVQAYVHQYITQLDAQSKVLPETNAYTKRLRNMTKNLTAVDGIPLNFKVYQENQVNAFACADGSVRVYTGIMDVMTDNELLGVIGHEIGHVAMKHTKKEMRTSMLTSAALEGLASTSSTMATLTDSQLGAIGNAVLNAQYSKKQESQADDYGYEFLKAVGKNPWGMAMSFEKLQKVSESSGSQASSVQKLFSSHPDTETRIKRMSERAMAEGYKRPAK
jgi:putative metalloprotease